MSMVDTRQEARAPETPGTISGRVAALAGAVSLVLMAISYSALGNIPNPFTDSGQKILSYVALHHGQLQLSAALTALAMSTALVWAAGLYRALRRAEGVTPGLAMAAFGGAVLTAASNVALAVIEGTVATRFHDLGPAGARVFWTMLLLTGGGALVGMFVLMGQPPSSACGLTCSPAGSLWRVPCWRSPPRSAPAASATPPSGSWSSVASPSPSTACGS